MSRENYPLPFVYFLVLVQILTELNLQKSTLYPLELENEITFSKRCPQRISSGRYDALACVVIPVASTIPSKITMTLNKRTNKS